MSVSLTLREMRPWTRAAFLSMVCLIAFSGAGAADSASWDLTPLEPPPEWRTLDAFQGTLTSKEFQDELEHAFLSTSSDAKGFFQVLPDHALITMKSRRPEATYRLQFGDGSRAPGIYWRPASALPPPMDPSKPLEGLRIAVDPGHIGGEWARVERRWFLIPDPPSAGAPRPARDGTNPTGAPKPNRPVQEGDLVLRVAELLEANLTAMGARVALVRRRLEPVTALRPPDLLDPVRKSLGLSPGSDPNPENDRLLRDGSERLFYLSAEIRARGERVNREFRPDLALCLHLNAEPWGDPARPSFVAQNHFHILINGCYSRSELMKDDQRFFLVQRLLQRTHPEELALAESIAAVMGPKLGLPPYEYRGNHAKRPGSNPFVWSRNLLATRIYECPVIYFEPYVMNHEVTHTRIQAGEYEGRLTILGAEYPNLFEEYASSVAEGVASYYRAKRSLPTGS